MGFELHLGPIFFSLLVGALLFTIFSFPFHVVVFLSSSWCYYPFHVAFLSSFCCSFLLFMVLFSSFLCCCFLVCDVIIPSFFALMLSSYLHCCFSSFGVVAFLFTLMFLLLHSIICVDVLLFMLLLSSLPRWCSPTLSTRFFVILFSFLHYYFPFVLLLFMCCYSLKDLVLPLCIPSCKNWEWSRMTTCIFF